MVFVKKPFVLKNTLLKCLFKTEQMSEGETSSPLVPLTSLISAGIYYRYVQMYCEP